MSLTPQPQKSPETPRPKRPFTKPRICHLGTVTTRTGQGGDSKEYDSYNENRK